MEAGTGRVMSENWMNAFERPEMNLLPSFLFDVPGQERSERTGTNNTTSIKNSWATKPTELVEGHLGDHHGDSFPWQNTVQPMVPEYIGQSFDGPPAGGSDYGISIAQSPRRNALGDEVRCDDEAGALEHFPTQRGHVKTF